MSETVTFYMEPDLCQSAQAGGHNFIGKIISVLSDAGMRVAYAPLPPEGAPAGAGYSLSHIKSPPDGRGLSFRRVYHYPFWQIEQSAERSTWDVASARFDPGMVSAKQAQWFYGYWQKRLFGAAPQQIRRDGFIYVPLQGRITAQRAFQLCSPLEMITHCLAHSPLRVVATLHPNARYDRSEIAALEKLEARHARLSVQTGGMEALLQACDFIATQNSSVAFNGYFFGKPALLFRKTDFHHIAVMADGDDLAAGFDAVQRVAPDYAAYVHWFWQQNSINAGRPEAAQAITARLRRFGWPV